MSMSQMSRNTRNSHSEGFSVCVELFRGVYLLGIHTRPRNIALLTIIINTNGITTNLLLNNNPLAFSDPGLLILHFSGIDYPY